MYERYARLWVDLSMNYSFELIRFAKEHHIGLFPAVGYFTFASEENGKLVTPRMASMAIYPGEYPNYELANEMGHFWPTQWVLDHLGTPLYLAMGSSGSWLSSFLYGLTELWAWFAGWLILRKCKLDRAGYWPLAIKVANYTKKRKEKAYNNKEWSNKTLDAWHSIVAQYEDIPYLKRQIESFWGDNA